MLSDRGPILQRVVRMSFDELGVDCVCCYLPKASDELILSLNRDEDAERRWPEELAQMVLAVARVGVPPLDPRDGCRGRVPLMLASQYLVVPIDGGEATIGALGVANRRSRVWSASHVGRLRDLARRAALLADRSIEASTLHPVSTPRMPL